MPDPQILDHFKNKYCRMCAGELTQGVLIFGEEGKRLRISEKIRKTLSVLVLEEDILPKKICTECCMSLEDYTHYKETVVDAQEKLSTIAKSLLSVSPSPGRGDRYEKLSKALQGGSGSSSGAGESPTKSHSPSEAESPPGWKERGKRFEAKNGSEVILGLDINIESDHPQEPVEVVEVQTEDDHRDGNPGSDIESNSEQEQDQDQPPLLLTEHVEGNSQAQANTTGNGMPASAPLAAPESQDISGPKSVGYVCELCDKMFASSGSYHNHVMTVHKGRKFSCPYCPYSYSQKASLIVHVRTHHSSQEEAGPKTHVCNSCPAAFYGKKELTRHVKSHVLERQYECYVCHKFYKTSKCLAKHVKVHLDKNAYVCPTCGKGFCRRSKLAEHQNIHSLRHSLGCGLCTKEFNSHPNYLKHFRRKHEDSLLVDGKVPAPTKNNPPQSQTVTTIDARQVQQLVSQSQPIQQTQETTEVTYVSAGTPLTGQNLSLTTLPSNAGTPLTGQNLSLSTPSSSVNWTDNNNPKQPVGMIFHQQMNGLDLVDCAIQSALITQELHREQPTQAREVQSLPDQQANTHLQHHDPNQPMELCYKSLTSAFQDMPMELTKVFQQSGPLELCVRNDNEPFQLVNVSSGREPGFGGRMDLIDLSGVTPFQQQPIDLISRTEACALNPQHQQQQQHLISGTMQGNSSVDLSLRSSFHEQSTSSFIRELLDLSARSEYHDHQQQQQQQQPMELNLSCSKSTPPNHQQASTSINRFHQQHSHMHNNHHGSSLQNLVYTDICLQNYTN